MANVETIIPFIFHFEAGVYGKNGEQLRLPLHQQFELARVKGWSDDKDDPGGATMIGVTIATFSSYRKSIGLSIPTKYDLHQISFTEWQAILKTMFWNKVRGDDITSQGIANILADWIWASGPTAIRRTQRLLNIKNDGIVGAQTLKEINSRDSYALFREIKTARQFHYRSCKGAWKYLSGWLRRLNAMNPDGTFNWNRT